MRVRFCRTALSLAVIIFGFLSAEIHAFHEHPYVLDSGDRIGDGNLEHRTRHVVQPDRDDEAHHCNACFFDRLLNSPLPAEDRPAPEEVCGLIPVTSLFRIEHTPCSTAVNRGPPQR